MSDEFGGISQIKGPIGLQEDSFRVEVCDNGVALSFLLPRDRPNLGAFTAVIPVEVALDISRRIIAAYAGKQAGPTMQYSKEVAKA